MAYVFMNRVREKTTKTGTGADYLLSTDVTGFQPFSVIGNGSKTIVRVELPNTAHWEVFGATYSLSNNRLTRNALFGSSNNGSAVNWPAGVKDVAITAVAERQTVGVSGMLSSIDNESTGQQEISLLAEDVITSLGIEDGYGINWVLTEDSLGTHLLPDRIVTLSEEEYASEIQIDLSATSGELHRFTLTGDPTLLVVNFEHNDPGEPGKQFTLNPVQDSVGGRTIDFGGSDQIWVFPDGEPALTLLPGGEDFLVFRVEDVSPATFRFVRAIHRPRRVDVIAFAPPGSASVTTTQEGVDGTPTNNTVYYIEASKTGGAGSNSVLQITGDYNVTGGTFNLFGPSGLSLTNIPWDVTWADFLQLIWNDQDNGTPCLIPLSPVNDKYIFQGFAGMGVGIWSGLTVATWSINSTNLIGGSFTAVINQAGSGGTPMLSGTWRGRLFGGAAYSAAIAINASATQIKDALEATAEIGVGNLSVTRHYILDGTSNVGGLVRVEFIGDLAGTEFLTLQVDSALVTNGALGAYAYQDGETGNGVNEICELSIAGGPLAGSVVLTIADQDVTVPFNATASEVADLVNSVLGGYAVTTSGGPLSSFAVEIEASGLSYQSTNLTNATVDDNGIRGHARLDWLYELNHVTLNAGSGDFVINLGDVQPSQTIHVAVENDGASGTLMFDSTGLTINWGECGAPEMPEDGETLVLKFIAVSATEVSASRFFEDVPRRNDDFCEPPSTAAITTTQAGVASLNDFLYEIWKFEEVAGTNRTGQILAVDLEEQGANVDHVAGIDGNAVNFNGAGYELETPSDTLGDPPQVDVSLSFWCYPRAVTDGISFQVKNSAVNAKLLIYQVDAGGGIAKAKAEVIVWTGTVGESNSVTSSGTLTLNSWNLLAVKLTASHVHVSLNGTAFESTARTHSGTLFGVTPVARINPTGVSPVDADLDEAAIWSAALSDSQIAALWSSGSGVFYPFAIGTNEKHALAITGSPTKGSVVITFFPGETAEADVEVPYNSSASMAETLISSVLGAGTVDVAGGPLPVTPLTIEYIGEYAGQDVTQAIVDDNGIDGHATLDWSRGLNYLLLKPGTYTPDIRLGDVQEFRTIRVAVETDGVTNVQNFDSVDFGNEGSPTLPGDGTFDIYELTSVDADTIIGRTVQTGLMP